MKNVLVSTYLADETYRGFVQIADDRGTSVSVLLSLLADQALRPARAHRDQRLHRASTKRPWRRWTTDEVNRLIALHGQRMSDGRIAHELGRVQSVVSRKRNDLGLAPHFEAPTR